MLFQSVIHRNIIIDNIFIKYIKNILQKQRCLYAYENNFLKYSEIKYFLSTICYRLYIDILLSISYREKLWFFI